MNFVNLIDVLKILSLSFVMLFAVTVDAKMPLGAMEPGFEMLQQGTSTPSAFQVFTVATVNIQDVVLKSQDSHTLNLAFNISNREGAQPAILYAINLYRKNTDGSLNRVDQKVFSNDMMSLQEGERVPKEISYEAPPFLAGDYVVELEARNQDGLILSLVKLREVVQFQSATQGVVLSDCYLTAGSDSQVYTLDQGVDVDSTESLYGHCAVTTTYDADQSFTPVVKTFYRSTFGELVDTKTLEAKIFAGSGKVTDYTFLVPLQSDPQAYDAMLSFTDNVGEQVSQQVVFHYVTRGQSATIQNVLLDDDRYESGDNAQVTVFWSGPADSFLGARAEAAATEVFELLVQLSNKDNVACADLATVHAISTGGTNVVDLPIKNECVDPIVSVQIIDGNGVLLAAREYRVISGPATPKDDGPITEKKNNFLLILLFFAAAAIVVLVYKRKMKNDTSDNESVNADDESRDPPITTLLLLLVAGSFMVQPLTAHADTIAISHMGGSHTAVFTVGIDKSVYQPLEDIIATASFVVDVCDNGVNFGINTQVQTWVKADGQLVFSLPDSSGSITLTAPAVAGNYYTYFTALVEFWREAGSGFNPAVGSARIPYTVVGSGLSCPYNGTLSWGTNCSANINTTVSQSANLEVQNTASNYNGEAIYYCENDGTLSLQNNWCEPVTSPQPSASIDASNCVIPFRNSSCASKVWWTSSGLTDPVMKYDGSAASTTASGSTNVFISYGLNKFSMNDGYIEFDSETVRATCAPNTTWFGGVCAPNYDLSAISAPVPTVPTLTQGDVVTFTAQVKNTGVNTIDIPFSDRFYYTFTNGNAPVPHPFPDITTQTIPFPAGEVRTMTSGPLLLTQSGNIRVTYCTDDFNDVPETNEYFSADNCKYTNYTINPGPAVPYGTVTAEDCVISYHQTGCKTQMFWDTFGVTTVDLHVTGPNSDFYYADRGVTRREWVGPYSSHQYWGSYGLNTVALIGDGNTLMTNQYNASCAPGLTWQPSEYDPTYSWCSSEEGVPGTIDLVSSADITVSGTLMQGQPVTFAAQVKNIGGDTIDTGFSDKFAYVWSADSIRHEMNPTKKGVPFVAGQTALDTSDSVLLDSSGWLQVIHCTDVSNDVAESVEFDGNMAYYSSTNNCRDAWFEVLPSGPVDGECGLADGMLFSEFDTDYYSFQPQCTVPGSSPSNTNFPALGGTETWTCSGVNGGSDSPICSASRENAAAASAVITAVACGIPVGQNACDVDVSWTSSNVSSPSVRNNGSEFSTSANNSTTFNLPIGNYGFAFYESGDSVPLSFDSVSVTCESGSSWNSTASICDNTPATPVISVKTNPSIVRVDGQVEVSVSIDSQEIVLCELRGVDNNPINFIHDGTVNQVYTYSYRTRPLKSTQEVTVTCEVSGFSSVKVNKKDRIEVVGVMQER